MGWRRFTAMSVVVEGIVGGMKVWLVAISVDHGHGCSLAFNIWSVVIGKIRSRNHWVHGRWRITQWHSVVSAMCRDSRRSGFSSIVKLSLYSNWIARTVDLQDAARPCPWFFSGFDLDSLIAKRSRKNS